MKPKLLKSTLLWILMKSFNQVLVARQVEKNGKTFIQHFWVNPDEVKHNDKVRYNRHLLDEKHPQRHTNNDDLKPEEIEIMSDEDVENILGSPLDPDSLYYKWSEHFTYGEKEAIKTYTGGPCRAINSYLRRLEGFDYESARQGFEDPDDEENDDYWNTRMLKLVVSTIPYLDKLISKFETPVPLKVHRIVGQEMHKQLMDAYNSKDQIFVEDGYCSTTVLQDSFGDEADVNMVIHLPPGTGIGAYMDHDSAYPGEYELLLARGTMFKVMGYKPATADRGPIFEMTAVGRKENNDIPTPSQLQAKLVKDAALDKLKGKK